MTSNGAQLHLNAGIKFFQVAACVVTLLLALNANPGARGLTSLFTFIPRMHSFRRFKSFLFLWRLNLLIILF